MLRVTRRLRQIKMPSRPVKVLEVQEKMFTTYQQPPREQFGGEMFESTEVAYLALKGKKHMTHKRKKRK